MFLLDRLLYDRLLLSDEQGRRGVRSGGDKVLSQCVPRGDVHVQERLEYRQVRFERIRSTQSASSSPGRFGVSRMKLCIGEETKV